MFNGSHTDSHLFTSRHKGMNTSVLAHEFRGNQQQLGHGLDSAHSTPAGSRGYDNLSWIFPLVKIPSIQPKRQGTSQVSCDLSLAMVKIPSIQPTCQGTSQAFGHAWRQNQHPNPRTFTVCLGEISNNHWSIKPGPAGTAKSTGSDPPRTTRGRAGGRGLWGFQNPVILFVFFISSGLLAVSKIVFDDPFGFFLHVFMAGVTFRGYDTLAVT